MKLLQQCRFALIYKITIVDVGEDLGNILDFKNVKKQSNTLTAYPREGAIGPGFVKN
jgi:hypothetical protein